MDETETRRLASQTVLQRRFSCTDVEVAQSQVPQEVPSVQSQKQERRGEEEGGGGHNNAQAANLRAMAVYWGPFLQRWSDKVSGLVTALCVLSMLIVLTDIMLRPSDDDRLICLSSPVLGLVGRLVLSGHSHRQLMQRFECTATTRRSAQEDGEFSLQSIGTYLHT